MEEMYCGSLVMYLLCFSCACPLSPISPVGRWRGKMQHALHHNLFHLIIVILVSIDAVIVIFELLIDVGAFSKIRFQWVIGNAYTSNGAS